MEIMFNKKKYLFGGNGLDESNFIATKNQYKNGFCSFAYYYPKEGINRFGNIIGTRKDIKILKDNIEIKPNINKFLDNLLSSSEWPWGFNEKTKQIISNK